ncbi:MAG TPA: four helix bundle protein [Candidatus Fimivivens sp.]|nr:four helix bundle protein [Candidatus Fimivivens sp.]
MNTESGKIRSFTDIVAWQEGHKVVLEIYRVTKSFPKEELFGLVSQMRRCSVSITSNIAEGFGRFSYKEKIQFYFIALGSVTELQNQMLIARDVGLLSKKDFDGLAERSVSVHKLINGLIKGAKQK